MNKKELLSMRKITATPKILELVREDTGKKETAVHTYRRDTYYTYKRYLYYKAIVENGILKLAVFPRKWLAAGEINPQYEIYLSKDERQHLTWDVRCKKWRTARINYLNYDIDDGYVYGNKPWASEETKKLVNAYLESGNLEVKEAVLNFQDEIGKEKLKKKYKSELEEIDAVMNAVPELPKDFDDWVLNSAFIDKTYLLYHCGDKENTAYCTHCGSAVHLKIRPSHNQKGKCPKCRTKAVLKSWKKQKYLVDEKKVGIIQKLTDGSGYILRRFNSRLRRTLESDWQLEEAGCWEINRFKLNNGFVETDYFEYGEYRTTGIHRWCHELNHGYGYYYYHDNNCVLYPRNLKRLRKGTELNYIPIEELWKHNPGRVCEAPTTLRKMTQIPKIEYLIKAGLYRLAWDIAESYHCDEKYIDWNQRKPWDTLKITKEQMKMCIRIDITARQLEVLQVANEYRMTLSPDQIALFATEIGADQIGEVFQYGHPGKFYRYISRLREEKIRSLDYMDYLEDIRFMHMEPTEDVLFPRNFQHAHQRLALQRQEREDEIKKMEIAEKDKILQAMLPELTDIYEMEDEQFKVILPTCKEDFNREGRENHNCVGGSYFDKMLKGQSCVMFLRRTAEPEKAFCTVEMEGDKILQCRAVRNSEPPKDAKEFMEHFRSEVAKRISRKKQQVRLLVTA